MKRWIRRKGKSSKKELTKNGGNGSEEEWSSGEMKRQQKENDTKMKKEGKTWNKQCDENREKLTQWDHPSHTCVTGTNETSTCNKCAVHGNEVTNHCIPIFSHRRRQE